MLILGHRGTGVTMSETRQQAEDRRKKGARGPENTLKAIELALQGGADGVEIDVFRTADDDLAVIHDSQLGKHVAGANGRVRDYKMEKLRRMDAGDGEGIPSLKDVFDLAVRYNAHCVNVELTGRNTYTLAYEQAVNSGYPLERVIFSSGDWRQLEKLRKLDSNIKIGLIFKPAAKNRFSEAKVNRVLSVIRPTSLHPRIDKASARLMSYAKAKGLDVIVFTSGEKHPDRDAKVLDFARKHKEAGNVHIITDFPAELVRALKNN